MSHSTKRESAESLNMNPFEATAFAMADPVYMPGDFPSRGRRPLTVDKDSSVYTSNDQSYFRMKKPSRAAGVDVRDFADEHEQDFADNLRARRHNARGIIMSPLNVATRNITSKPSYIATRSLTPPLNSQPEPDEAPEVSADISAELTYTLWNAGYSPVSPLSAESWEGPTDAPSATADTSPDHDPETFIDVFLGSDNVRQQCKRSLEITPIPQLPFMSPFDQHVNQQERPTSMWSHQTGVSAVTNAGEKSAPSNEKDGGWFSRAVDRARVLVYGSQAQRKLDLEKGAVPPIAPDMTMELQNLHMIDASDRQWKLKPTVVKQDNGELKSEVEVVPRKTLVMRRSTWLIGGLCTYSFVMTITIIAYAGVHPN